MTWGNLGIRLLAFAILLPLALASLSVEEVNLWLVLQAVVSLQFLLDLGFTPTFIRLVAYACSENNSNGSIQREGSPAGNSDHKMPEIIQTMRFIYQRLGWLALFFLTTAGTLAVAKPVHALPDPNHGWIAWSIVLVSGVLVFRWSVYGAYLQGLGQIALYQRWQSLAGLVSVIAGIAVLVADSGLITLVAVLQTGPLVGALMARRLAILHGPDGTWHGRPRHSSEVLKTAWPAAWRSGIGVGFGFGIIQGSGIVYAQLAPASDAAAFLLAQRLLRTLTLFINAPFYSRIPSMARLYMEGQTIRLLESAKTGMIRANWLLVAGLIFIGFGASPFLLYIGSETPFVTSTVWWLLSVALVLERIGAMHLQLYSTTNHIVWHIANGFAGLLMLASIPVAFLLVGVNGIPIGIIIGYAFFYVPYSLFLSYSKFTGALMHMDILASVIPMTIITLLAAASFCW